MTSDQYKQAINALGVVFQIATDISDDAEQDIVGAHQELFEAESRNDKNDVYNAQDHISRAISKYALAKEILTNAKQIRRNLLAIANHEILF